MVETIDRKNTRKERTGVVLSDKMQKTIVVQIRRKAMHKRYGKVIEKATKFKAHDEKGEARVGDTVRIAETRPISKEKRWRLVEIVSRAPGKDKEVLKDVLEDVVGVRS
jgi:small subunit ribosomal protein S17